jgi:hypothetical protein
METCNEHDDCIIVFKRTFGQKCPMCELEKEKEQTEKQLDIAQDYISDLESLG